MEVAATQTQAASAGVARQMTEAPPPICQHYAHPISAAFISKLVITTTPTRTFTKLLINNKQHRNKMTTGTGGDMAPERLQ